MVSYFIFMHECRWLETVIGPSLLARSASRVIRMHKRLQSPRQRKREVTWQQQARRWSRSYMSTPKTPLLRCGWLGCSFVTASFQVPRAAISSHYRVEIRAEMQRWDLAGHCNGKVNVCLRVRSLKLRRSCWSTKQVRNKVWRFVPLQKRW